MFSENVSKEELGYCCFFCIARVEEIQAAFENQFNLMWDYLHPSIVTMNMQLL